MDHSVRPLALSWCFIILAFPALVLAKDCSVNAGTSDCNLNGKKDSCDLGSSVVISYDDGAAAVVPSNDCNTNKVPDDCEADADNDGVVDACETIHTCTGSCLATSLTFDEDNDAISNCQEITDKTDPCDTGSFIERLQPMACGGANGFLSQIDIATIINKQDTLLSVNAEYRDLTGALKGQVSFELKTAEKRDLIVNDMGLEPDTYGSLCVFTNAKKIGAWTGGITIYERRDVTSNGFDGDEIFDYALYYPFHNPRTAITSVSLNTNSLGTDGLGTVANWISVTDAIAGDQRGLVGAIFYYDTHGRVIAIDDVALPDGGRGDFGAHNKLGPRVVGLAQFVPDDRRQDYYFEATRYFYEGVGASVNTFYTAFPIPIRSVTGAPVTGKASSRQNELSVIELVNANTNSLDVALRIFDAQGAIAANETVTVARKGSLHKIVSNEIQAQTVAGAARVDAPPESLIATTLVYGLDSNGMLLYIYSPPFTESAGTVQLTEFNSFISHENEFEVFNSTNTKRVATLEVLNFDQTVLGTFPISLPPHGTITRRLSVPPDTYGALVVTGDSGLIVRNDVMREGQYIMPYLGR